MNNPPPVETSRDDATRDGAEREEPVLDDARLWAGVLNNDQFSFESIVIKYQNAVSAVAFSILGNFSWSQEITQETFWQAWRQKQQLESPNRLGAWLCGIARNLSHQMLRNERRRRTGPLSEQLASEICHPDASPEELNVGIEEEALVWNALESIPETYREALVLFYREGQSVQDVAAVLDVTPEAVRQRLSRGREKLRDELAKQVEEVLVRSRSGQATTRRIIMGIAALTTALKAGGSVAAATAGSTLAGSATGAALASSTTGALAGVSGAAAGVAGAWFGIWFPAQVAPTMNERRFLEREGRHTFRVTVLFTLAILSAVGLRMLELPVVWYAASISILSVSFTLWIVRRSIFLNRKVQEIRASASPDDPPNLSTVKEIAARFAWSGKSYTSSWRILGIPCIDIQFQDPGKFQDLRTEHRVLPSRAFGWIALGDRATGILFASGGVARGLIAVGGIATGGIAFGGLSLGVIAIGGCAGGVIAFGGAAAGWDSAGGVTLGYHSAAGGAAAARYIAVGGYAASTEHASGGIAWAPNANTESAAAIAKSESWLCILLWITEHQIEFTLITLIVALSPMFIAAAFQRFSPRQT